MATYSNYKSVLAAALDKYAWQGFGLKEESDDFLILYHDREEILRARQNNANLTPAFIQCECESHLTMCHGV